MSIDIPTYSLPSLLLMPRVIGRTKRTHPPDELRRLPIAPWHSGTACSTEQRTRPTGDGKIARIADAHRPAIDCRIAASARAWESARGSLTPGQRTTGGEALRTYQREFTCPDPD